MENLPIETSIEHGLKRCEMDPNRGFHQTSCINSPMGYPIIMKAWLPRHILVISWSSRSAGHGETARDFSTLKTVVIVVFTYQKCTEPSQNQNCLCWAVHRIGFRENVPEIAQYVLVRTIWFSTDFPSNQSNEDVNNNPSYELQ